MAPCILKYSVKWDVNRGGGGEWAEVRGGMGGGRGVNVDVRSAVVVMILCSLFLGTSCPFRATVSSIVLTGSLIGNHEYINQRYSIIVLPDYLIMKIYELNINFLNVNSFFSLRHSNTH